MAEEEDAGDGRGLLSIGSECAVWCDWRGNIRSDSYSLGKKVKKV